MLALKKYGRIRGVAACEGGRIYRGTTVLVFSSFCCTVLGFQASKSIRGLDTLRNTCLGSLSQIYSLRP